MSKENPFKYYKTSPEIIKLAVMYYVRYPLSLRQVEDILHERGIDICHETIRYWWNNLGLLFSKEMKKKPFSSPSNWRWHIDEVFAKINGELHYLWRAVDQEGTILDCVVTKKRDKKAALKILNMEHLQNTTQYLNNQVENSHLHFRRREKMWNKFRSMRSLQKFTSIQSSFLNHFNHQRHLENRKTFKDLRQQSLDSWQEICIK